MLANFEIDSLCANSSVSQHHQGSSFTITNEFPDVIYMKRIIELSTPVTSAWAILVIIASLL